MQYSCCLSKVSKVKSDYTQTCSTLPEHQLIGYEAQASRLNGLSWEVAGSVNLNHFYMSNKKSRYGQQMLLGGWGLVNVVILTEECLTSSSKARKISPLLISVTLSCCRSRWFSSLILAVSLLSSFRELWYDRTRSSRSFNICSNRISTSWAACSDVLALMPFIPNKHDQVVDFSAVYLGTIRSTGWSVVYISLSLNLLRIVGELRG